MSTILTTFLDLYAEPASDPNRTSGYATALSMFAVPPTGTGYDSNRVRTMVLDANPDHAMGLVGFFPYPGEDAGRTRFIHAAGRFPSTMGVVSPHDGQAYATLDDVSSGLTTTVGFPTLAFGAVSATALVVPIDITTAEAGLTANPGLALLGPIVAGADAKAVRVPSMMWVPPPLIPLLIGQRLSPREFFFQVVFPLEAAGTAANFGPFVDWALAAITIVNTGDVHAPTLRAADLVSPIGDPAFLGWRQRVLHSRLPSLANPTPPATTAATTQIASLMADVLQVQRDQRTDAQDARVRAVRPKTISEFFKQYTTDKLMLLCDVSDEINLPEVWRDIAAGNGKRERNTVEMAIRQSANEFGAPELAPVITPTLVKKIVSVRFVGSDLDNLGEGLSPFCMIVVDHTTVGSEQAYADAVSSAQDYDDLVGGSTAADLSDLKSLKSSDKFIIPTSYATARAMLTAFLILIGTLLGDSHDLTTEVQGFLTAYTRRENFFMGRLQRADSKNGPGRLLRFIQLHTRAYFFSVDTAATLAERQNVSTPAFKHALHQMTVGDMTWLPELPSGYYKPSTDPIDSPSPSKTEKDKDKKASATQVRNTKLNIRFDDFKLAISQSKFNDLIKKVGAPPTVKRNGTDVPMCASYHLRGNCFTNCSRKADHDTHSKQEDDQLYEWCKLAFE